MRRRDFLARAAGAFAGLAAAVSGVPIMLGDGPGWTMDPKTGRIWAAKAYAARIRGPFNRKSRAASFEWRCRVAARIGLSREQVLKTDKIRDALDAHQTPEQAHGVEVMLAELGAEMRGTQWA